MTARSTPAPTLPTNAQPERPSRVPALLALALLLPLALFLRLLATHNDLWLDEIISLQNARALKSLWQVFTTLHTDNNHYLNSLYLYLVGNPANDSTFRYFSVLCGVLTIAAGYWAAVPRGRTTALLFATLLTFSYPLIHFSSEARGYSGALLGTVVAFAALLRFLRVRSWPMAILYAAATSFALLSHLTACLVWFPLALASLLFSITQKPRLPSIAAWFALNTPPAALLTLLYFIDIRSITPLGGPIMTLAHGLLRLLALSLAWPATDTTSILFLLIPLVALIAWQFLALARQRNPLWLILTFILLTPLLCALFLQPAFFSPRYFLVIVPFLYLPLAMLLSLLLKPPSKARAALGFAILALFVVGQFALYLQFLKIARGQPTAALRYISQHTPTPFVNIASSQDFRATVELSYFAPKTLGKSRPISYIRQNDQSFFSPDWYLLHSEGFDPIGPETLAFPDQPPWYRVAWFPASELSGQAWTLYSHQPPRPNSSAFQK